MSREIHVLGGPNGAGKTSTAALLLPGYLGVDQFVNADLIAAGLSPFAPETSAFEAGRLMLQRIHEMRRRRISFAFETTLATRSHVRFLREAQADGYSVHVLYVWLESVELALSRIAARVREGGHAVPADVVKRRYSRGIHNLFHLYKPLADAWTICDNTQEHIRVVAHGRRGDEENVLDASTFARIKRGDRYV